MQDSGILENDPVASGEYSVNQIKELSYRQARARFKIGYITWRRIKSGKLDVFRPHRGGRPLPQETITRIIDSVRISPQFSTIARASILGLRTETVQNVLKSQGLNRSIARLRFAGYEVEAVQPLQDARKRRVVALSPGIYTSTDFKTYGVVLGRGGSPSRWVCGCLCVDQLTGYATVRLDTASSTALALRTLKAHQAAVKALSGSPLRGVILSDNGPQYDSKEWRKYTEDSGLILRYTRPNHPWSNGKAEALNKTLKYQALPAICTGVFDSVADIETALIAWMHHYNTKRYHGGWINKGLPPEQLWRLWSKTEGRPLEKLIRLSVIGEGDLAFVRVMGCDRQGKAIVRDSGEPVGTPFALVIDKSGQPGEKFKALTNEPGDGTIAWFNKHRVRRSNVRLAK